jgi:hypothetical protein
VEYLYNNPQRLVWAGDYAEPETKRKNNVYFRCADNKKIAPKGIFKKVGDDEGIVCDEANLAIRYIVNHSKNQYVDLNSLPKDKDGWQIHALPLLTLKAMGKVVATIGEPISLPWGHGQET